MTDAVRYELRDRIAWVTMDDGKANALSLETVPALVAAVERAEGEAAALVIAGRPGRFSAGFDLKTMQGGAEGMRALLRAGGALYMRLYDSPLPTVMAVTGHAVAGGILLAATGDVRVGVRGDFKLGLNEVAIGLPVPLFGRALARDRLRTEALLPAVTQARLYDPDAGLAAGWLDRVEDPDGFEAAVAEEAARLAALGQPAYGITKRALRADTLRIVRDGFEAELDQLTWQQ